MMREVVADPLIIVTNTGIKYMFKLHRPMSTFACKRGVHRIFLPKVYQSDIESGIIFVGWVGGMQHMQHM